MSQGISTDVLRVAREEFMRVAIYARVSTDVQEEDGTSLETQIENCLVFAEANGYIVVVIFREVFTGALYRERPDLTKMRQMYRDGEINGVLFNTFDRFSRNQIHLGVLFDEMQHYNIRIDCVKEQFDRTPAGQFMRNALAFVAEVEREKIIQRTNDGKRKRAKNGKLLGGGVPRYGYAWNENRTAFVINPLEATIVLRIYAMALEGISIHTIAATLTQEGVPTRGNIGTQKFKGVWLHSTVHRILSSPCYMGEAYVYRTRQEKVNGHRLTTYRNEEEQIKMPEGVVPAIIDRVIFERVQVQLLENKVKSSRNNKYPEDTLLRCGLVVCGYCERNGVVTRKSDNKIDYRCKSTGDKERGECEGFTIAAHILDNAAWQHAVEIIKDPKQVAQKLQEKKRKNPTEGEFSPIERRLREIEKEVQNLLKMGRYAQNEDSIESLGRLLHDLERENLGLLTEQKKLQKLELLYKEEQEAIAAFEQRCIIYREKLEDPDASFSYQEKREALKYFGIKAHVWRLRHDPHFEIASASLSVVFPLS
ncbi:MAG: recombinase family protein [Ktedonobacteraceae bacterium]